MSDFSIEHLCSCPVAKTLGQHFLEVPNSNTRIKFFCLENEDMVTFTKRIAHVHILKRTLDTLRHNPLADPVLMYRARAWELNLRFRLPYFKHSLDGLPNRVLW